MDEFESKISYFKSELLSKNINQDLLKELNEFLFVNNSSTILDKKDFYLKFLNDLITLLPFMHTGFDSIDKWFLYNDEKNKVIKILQQDELDSDSLSIIDDFFLNEKIRYYVNLDDKSLRMIEDKLYRKLVSGNQAYNLLQQKLANNEQLNISLGVYLALEFYRNSKHPAQIVTFNRGSYFGHYNNADGNINIDLEKFLRFTNNNISLENSQNNNILFNLELLQLIYHECTHFKMLYNNDEYYYETELADISADYNIDNIHDDFYLEFCANTESCKQCIALLKKLDFQNRDYLIYLLENINYDYLKAYYHIINGVRTIDPHEQIYSELEEVIKADKINDDNHNKYALAKLKQNKNEQEVKNAIFDNYTFSEEEIKKILLVVMLEYKDGHTYSRFNQDIIKDILTLELSMVILKYQRLEYKKALQELYRSINKNKNYDEKETLSSIMALPIGYPFLDKIQELSNQPGLVNRKPQKS